MHTQLHLVKLTQTISCHQAMKHKLIFEIKQQRANKSKQIFTPSSSTGSGGFITQQNTYLFSYFNILYLHVRIKAYNVKVQTCTQSHLNRFLPRDALLSAVYAVVVCLCVCLSVCVSVCVSVTLRYCIKTAKRRITQTTPHDSPMTLVF